MTTTLTDRYVAATVKSLPPAAQDDVRAELEASIIDAVEARIDGGGDPDHAERAVLTDLGDPAVLAAGYADRPLHLIGPRYYLTWWRLLKLLLAIVPGCVLAGVALGNALTGAGAGGIIGEAVAASISSAMHVFFWTTLVFAVLERTGADATTPWDVDQLPEPSPAGAGRSDLVASLVFLGLMIGALMWDQLRGFAPVGGQMLPILNPGLWPWWTAALIGIVVLEVVLAFAVYRRGRWTPALAIANTALAVLFVSWAMTLLGRGQLINPALVDAILLTEITTPDTLRTLGVILGFSIVGVSIWDVIDGWLKSRRDGR